MNNDNLNNLNNNSNQTNTGNNPALDNQNNIANTNDVTESSQVSAAPLTSPTPDNVVQNTNQIQTTLDNANVEQFPSNLNTGIESQVQANMSHGIGSQVQANMGNGIGSQVQANANNAINQPQANTVGIASQVQANNSGVGIATQTQSNLNNEVTNQVQETVTQPVNNEVQNANQAVNGANNQTNAQSDTTISSENVDLIKAFIGKNADAILTEKCNIPALIIPDVYMLYRKMVANFFLYCIIAGILTSLLSSIYLIVIVAIRVYLMFRMDKIYLRYVKKKVDKIIKNNPGASYDDIKSLCAQKGGVSVATVVIIIVLWIAVAVAAAIFVGGTLSKTRSSIMSSQACANGPEFSTTLSDGSSIDCGSATGEIGNRKWVCTYRSSDGKTDTQDCSD